MTLHHLLKDLQKANSKEKAKNYQRFFNQEYTDKKDRFLGVTLPLQRKIANRHPEVNMQDLQKLLKSDIHEYRMVAGIILCEKFKENPNEEFVNFYIKNLKRFNNWDLIDTTAHKILGNFLLTENKKRKILYDLTKSTNLWERRASIIATLEFIRKKEFGDTLKIAEILLKDTHHLTHKAIGWMLREIGKRNEEVLLDFLKNNYSKLPRVTLRYAIERFSEEERKNFLKGNFI